MSFAAWNRVYLLTANQIYFGSDLTNYVAWVDLNNYANIISNTRADLGDVRTATLGGTELARVVYPDIGFMKVILPTAFQLGTPINIFYDNPSATDYAATDPYGQFAVMNPTYSYGKSFWELAPASASFAADDEATNNANNNGTAVNLGSARNAGGSLSHRWDFTGAVAGSANADRIDIGTNGTDLSAGWPYTLSSWVTIKNTGYTFGLQTIFADYASFTGQRNFIFGYQASQGQFRFSSWNASNAANNAFSTTNRSTEPNGTEHHVMFTVDASGNWAFYVDGVLDGSGTFVSNYHYNGGSAQINVGAVYRSSNWHDLLAEGYLADLRVSETQSLSADWAWAEFNNKQSNFWIDGGWQFNGVQFLGHTTGCII